MQAQTLNEPAWIPGYPMAVITMDTDTALFTSLIIWLIARLKAFNQQRSANRTTTREPATPHRNDSPEKRGGVSRKGAKIFKIRLNFMAQATIFNEDYEG